LEGQLILYWVNVLQETTHFFLFFLQRFIGQSTDSSYLKTAQRADLMCLDAIAQRAQRLSIWKNTTQILHHKYFGWALGVNSYHSHEIVEQKGSQRGRSEKN
jgi:hypothetical protein